MDPRELESPPLSPPPLPSASTPSLAPRSRWTLLVALASLALVALFLANCSGATTGGVGATAQRTATAQALKSTSSVATTPNASATATTSHQATKAPTSPTKTPTPTVPPKPPTIERIIASATISPGVPVVATCPSHEIALSGGWYFSNSNSTEVNESLRYANGWGVFAFGPGTQISVYVLCLQNAPSASVVERDQTMSVGANSTVPADLSCNIGEIAVGSGFAHPNSDVFIYISAPHSTSEWSVSANNAGTDPVNVTFYIECLKAAKVVTNTVSATASASPSASGGTQASCPTGSLLAGGGFNVNAAVVIFDTHPQSTTAWETYVYNPKTYTDHLTDYAVCLSFSG